MRKARLGGGDYQLRTYEPPPLTQPTSNSLNSVPLASILFFLH